MSRFSASFLVLALAVGATACAPQVGRHGYQAIDVQPSEIVVGTDTRETVRTRLGSPSATSTFEDDIWYYISQTTETYTYNHPEVSQRSVTAISFDETSGLVTEVRSLDQEDGQQLAMSERQTPTRGRELTVLEQLLGNIGRGQLPRTDQDTPGQQRRE